MLRFILTFISVVALFLGMNIFSHKAIGTGAVSYSHTSNVMIKMKRDTKINLKIKDSLINKQWMIGYTNSDKAWELSRNAGEVKVAVVDSGVDYNSPDLKHRVLRNLGYNFVDNTRDAMDDFGHGTEVAGVIAAEQGNGVGISGIAGPYNVKIIPIKVLNSKGTGDSQTIAEGIMYAVDQGAEIINVSIDFDTHDRYIKYALRYAKNNGKLVVVAAGNSNNNCDNYSPAGDDGAYTVSAISSKGNKADFSSYGTNVSIASPGVDVFTTLIGGKYGIKSGTSIAAPVVAGVAAMVKAVNKSLSAYQIASILNNTATDVLVKGKDTMTGYGIVDAYKAVSTAKKLYNVDRISKINASLSMK